MGTNVHRYGILAIFYERMGNKNSYKNFLKYIMVDARFSNHILIFVSYLETVCWLKVLTRNIS